MERAEVTVCLKLKVVCVQGGTRLAPRGRQEDRGPGAEEHEPEHHGPLLQIHR